MNIPGGIRHHHHHINRCERLPQLTGKPHIGRPSEYLRRCGLVAYVYGVQRRGGEAACAFVRGVLRLTLPLLERT